MVGLLVFQRTLLSWSSSLQCPGPDTAKGRIHERRQPQGEEGGEASSQRGSSTVELALILPVFLFLVFGLIELSVALYNLAVLTNASREGARAGIVLRNPKLSSTEIQQVVLNYTAGGLITFGSAITPVITVTQSTPAAFPNPIRVKVDYTYTGLGLGALMSAVNQPVVLSATSSMINE